MNVPRLSGMFEILIPMQRFPNTRLLLQPVSLSNRISRLLEDFLYPRFDHEESIQLVLGRTRWPKISSAKFIRTINRVGNEKLFSMSAPNSAFVVLLLSVSWQDFSAKRYNTVGICSSGPNVSINTLNNLLLADLPWKTYARRRCLGIKSKLLTKAAIIGVVLISV